MTLEKLREDVAALSEADLAAFAQWFGEYLGEAWDRQIEADIRNGRLDAAAEKADAAFRSGKCTRISDGPR